ncbi:hypothetical protein Tamer19_49630 [Cupriavidus sp. TA19]|uniref:2OG-Fe(II)-dependent halogenase WelO5 family protein n=1 Tax=unclassified Cupriavidus TaxID=2640874 RepID=UPI000E2EFAD1|nr:MULTISPECIES: hypothetical protein [unclassified Cupriavidus]BDB29755.1 2OG-Fe(II) oxygenase [Cupriavidus sp. P-10]GLC95554.1 hypothetical protein Tamer19_49630 [Cupriavidus sp. TA19]
MATWTSLREHSLTRENLEALLNNKIPAIRIKGFATPEECIAFTQSAKRGNIKYYNVAKRIGYIGMAQYEYRWDRPKSDYFDAVKVANADLAEVTARAFDPVQRLIDTLSSVYPHKVGAAEEPGMGHYFAGIIRLASEGVDLHADYAPFNTPDYSIRDIDAQLGWNFFSEQPKFGGITTVHNAPWTPERVEGEIPKSYGLSHDIVAGAPAFEYAPTAGDVVIFNTRNPHEIGAGIPEPGVDRVSIGSFIGRMPDRSLAMWA